MQLDRDYWQRRYDEHTDTWDIGSPSTPLKSYIDQLARKDLRILIPGCGRAWEGQYLHELGFTNVLLMDLTGEPFAEIERRCPTFPKDHLLVGDFFTHQGQYDRILEQTFFCAIPVQLRHAYVEHMSTLLAPMGKLVGVLFDDPAPGKRPGEPPYGGSRAEYLTLFAPHFATVSIAPCYNSIPPRAGREVWLQATKP
jgi:methyl halide transferase